MLHAPIEGYDDFKRLQGWLAPTVTAQLIEQPKLLPPPPSEAATVKDGAAEK
jgi:hypothetical protein